MVSNVEMDSEPEDEEEEYVTLKEPDARTVQDIHEKLSRKRADEKESEKAEAWEYAQLDCQFDKETWTPETKGIEDWPNVMYHESTTSVSRTCLCHSRSMVARNRNRTNNERQDAPEVERQDAPEVERQDAPEVERQDAPEVERQDAPEVERQDAPAEERQVAPARAAGYRPRRHSSSALCTGLRETGSSLCVAPGCSFQGRGNDAKDHHIQNARQHAPGFLSTDMELRAHFFDVTSPPDDTSSQTYKFTTTVTIKSCR
ncbi:Hypp6871 [Branchiostoma lanceolatum]|uniref:Hypp6871 protein n=1 Tax=Branchiostoma lanceolatum TaxID=7740 RepID=A0A8K0EB97_BRALA|nr:Hypp6871 [Branchiostoma lanceolatum]